jgi:two-component system sensor histidine kinase HupT/HoxJ
VLELPEMTIPPPGAEDDDDAASDSLIFVGQREVVAVLVEDALLRKRVVQILASGGKTSGEHDAISASSVIVAQTTADVGAAVTRIRREARSDAAILVIVDEGAPGVVADAHAAGAFACVRTPIVAEELLGLVASAEDSQSAKFQVVDLARRLDLEAHLASIGRIGAGLSHEISAPLMVAQLSLDSVRSAADDGRVAVDHLRALAFAPVVDRDKRISAARAFLETRTDTSDALSAADDIGRALDRIRSLLSSMKELVGRRPPALERVDLTRVVANVRRLFAASAGAVTLEEAADEALVVWADEVLLTQILVNLASNAAHAAATFPSPRVRLHAYRAGRHAVVSVRDNGPGIAPDLQERIFEPFFTTRREEGGTGLGLALCREYAIQMRAQLSVWSIPGRGACFRVRLEAEPRR